MKLQETTVRLNNILGNVKLRGQWGERMAEDIIRYAGLIENVNYLKQNVNAEPDQAGLSLFFCRRGIALIWTLNFLWIII